MGFFKKLIPKEIRKPVKAIVDPIIDLGTSAVKAIISPFTGAFSLPDISTDFTVGNELVKAATTVDFRGANRAVPVLYGNNIEIATIPVFVDTWGDNSADTSRQYLYMAAIISQGFHASNNVTSVDEMSGCWINRITIDGKPVNISNTGSATSTNPAYTDDSSANTETYGVLASGKGGNQPRTYTIDRGTFANRLQFQVFDGSSDQPVSTLLSQHPKWGSDFTLSGFHYIALRFELQAADEVVTGKAGDGEGTFANPYSAVPAVVVTTCGRNTPNIIAGKITAPYWQERFSGMNGPDTASILSFHRRLDQPDADGAFSSIYSSNTIITNDFAARTQFNFTYELDYDKQTSVSAQADNIHTVIYDNRATINRAPYIFLQLGTLDSTVFTPYTDAGFWMKNVGGDHYRFLNAFSKDYTFGDGSTLGAYRIIVPDPTQTFSFDNLDETYPAPVNGNAVYRFFANDSNLSDIDQAMADGDSCFLRVRNPYTGTNDRYQIVGSDALTSADGYIDLHLTNSDSSALPENFHTTIANDAQIIFENDTTSGTAQTAHPANWDDVFTSGYLKEGLTLHGYTCDSNPVEMLLDYMLNSDYGAGISLDELDRASWVKAAIACDRYRAGNNDVSFGTTEFYTPSTVETREYLDGENADPVVRYGTTFPLALNGYDRQFVIDTSKTHLDNVNLMLSSMGAQMPFINGKYHLQLENAGNEINSGQTNTDTVPLTALTLSATITEDNIIDSFNITTATLNDTYNSIKVDYTDLQFYSQPNSMIKPDPVTESATKTTLQTLDSKVLESNFSIPSIYHSSIAEQFATLLLQKSRSQPVANFSVNAIGYNITPGDFVRLDMSTRGINDVYRVTDVSIQYDNTVLITAIRHLPELYHFVEGDISTTGYKKILDV